MSDLTTIARPYAKALFETALDTKQLPAWSAVLQVLAQAVLDPQAQRFIDSPSATDALQCQLLLSVVAAANAEKSLPEVESLVALLAHNKRLMVLPDISAQFEALRAEQEKTLRVTVDSFTPLSAAQQQTLIQSLSQRLQRKISLDVKVDKSLLGGAVVRAGDLVIDGSVRGKLSKLGTYLAA